jgi:hypothetical protein
VPLASASEESNTPVSKAVIVRLEPVDGGGRTETSPLPWGL